MTEKKLAKAEEELANIKMIETEAESKSVDKKGFWSKFFNK